MTAESMGQGRNVADLEARARALRALLLSGVVTRSSLIAEELISPERVESILAKLKHEGLIDEIDVNPEFERFISLNEAGRRAMRGSGSGRLIRVAAVLAAAAGASLVLTGAFTELRSLVLAGFFTVAAAFLFDGFWQLLEAIPRRLRRP